jgi:hypothetical protein
VNNSPTLTPDEWTLLRTLVADTPGTQLIEEDEGCYIEFCWNGNFSGIMHPRAFLQLFEDEDENPPTVVDMLKHVDAGKLKL